MKALLKSLQTDIGSQFRVVTETTSDGLLITCLHSDETRVMSRRLSSNQMKNQLLLAAVISDLKSQLLRTSSAATSQ